MTGALITRFDDQVGPRERRSAREDAPSDSAAHKLAGATPLGPRKLTPTREIVT